MSIKHYFDSKFDSSSFKVFLTSLQCFNFVSIYQNMKFINHCGGDYY